MKAKNSQGEVSHNMEVKVVEKKAEKKEEKKEEKPSKPE